MKERVTKLAWSLVRSESKPSLDLELRLGIETLWALPLPGTQWNAALLPSNVLVGSDGSVTIGAANTDGSGAFERYLPPEVRDGAGWNLLSAIYSVGVLLFEASTGQTFESQRALQAALSKHRAAAQTAASDRWLVPLLEILAKATHEAPQARWQTPEAFSRELARVAAHRIATRDELGMRVARLVHAASARPAAAATRRSARPVATRESATPVALIGGQRYQGASLAVVISVAVLVVTPTITRSGAPARETASAQGGSSSLRGSRLIQRAAPEMSLAASSNSEGAPHPKTAKPEHRDSSDVCRDCASPPVEPVVEPASAVSEESATNEASHPEPPPTRQRAPKRRETFDYGI